MPTDACDARVGRKKKEVHTDAYGRGRCVALIFIIASDAYGAHGWVGVNILIDYECILGGVGGWVCQNPFLM